MPASSNKLPIGVLISGSGSNLQSIIDACEAGRLDAEVKVVVSNNPTAYGLERCYKHSIPTVVITKDEFPDKAAFDDEIIKTLNANGVNLVALAGFMRILTPALVAAFPMRIMNIHPSLLPAFPGLDVQRKALEHGVRFAGCTVHFVDAGVDSGPIIIQAAVPVLDDDTPETLSKRILVQEHRIYPQAIQLYAEGRLNVRNRRVFITHGKNAETSLTNPQCTLFKDDR
ncbi:MAG: phosphoribosylglycinamide formyltransferase [Deltaproteobacteria bacterium]|nr:phosphoribosylglycinamide formyltransferase [Deltaproteobacteria bacterium]